MHTFFSFSQSQAKNFLKIGKTLSRTLGLKLIRAPKIHAPELQLPVGRMLIVIPRRVGNACTRNLIRRRLKSIYLQENLSSQGLITALFVYPEAKSLKFEELKAFLTTAFKPQNYPVHPKA